MLCFALNCFIAEFCFLLGCCALAKVSPHWTTAATEEYSSFRLFLFWIPNFALIFLQFNSKLDWRPMEIGKSWRDARSARRIVPQGTSLENSNFYSKNLKIPYPSLRGYVEDHNGWNYLTPGYFSDSQDQGYYARSGNEHSNSHSGYYGFLSSGGQGKEFFCL